MLAFDRVRFRTMRVRIDVQAETLGRLVTRPSRRRPQPPGPQDQLDVLGDA